MKIKDVSDLPVGHPVRIRLMVSAYQFNAAVLRAYLKNQGDEND